MNIKTAILGRIPEELLPSTDTLDQLITKWKIFLCSLVNPEISETQALSDAAWGILEAELIINLVLYDSINLAYQKYLIGQAGGSSSTTTTGGTGAVKKIVTGPAEAEFFPMSETISEIMKPGGIFTGIKDSICILSHRLNIRIYICDQEPSSIKIAPKVHRTYNSSRKRR